MNEFSISEILHGLKDASRELYKNAEEPTFAVYEVAEDHIEDIPGLITEIQDRLEENHNAALSYEVNRNIVIIRILFPQPHN